MKKKRVTNGWFYWVLLILAVWFFAGCSKAQVAPVSRLDKYSMVVDWYTLDTTKRIARKEWIYDSIYSETIKRQFESTPDLWYIDCNMLDRLQHLYYTKNGKKIQPSSYPKN